MSKLASSIHISLGVIIGIGFLAATDLTLRYFVFGRLESAAIDFSLFAFAYSTVEAARRIADSDAGQTKPWAERTAVGFGCLLVLAISHIRLDKRLEDQVDALLERHTPQPATSKSIVTRQVTLVRIAAMKRGVPLISRTVLLTFSGPELPSWVREGKRNWRQDAANFISDVNGLEGGMRLTEADFLLPRIYRFGASVIFLIFALASIVTPAITIRR